MRPASIVARHPIAAYFALAYLFSWGLWLPIVLGYQGALRDVLFIAGIFGPALAGAAATRLAGRSVRAWLRGILRWRVRGRWYAVALGFPVALVAVVSAAYALLGNAVDPSLLPGRWAAYLSGLLFVTVLGGGQEEFGWRGFALPRLEARFGPVAGTLVLGLLWGLWHLPIVAADPEFQHGLDWVALLPVIGLSLASVVGYAFVLTWLFNRTGSVLLAILLHASFNTANDALIPLPAEAVEGAAYQTLSIVMTVTLAVVVLGLIAATRGRLGYGAGPLNDKNPRSDEGLRERPLARAAAPPSR